MVAQTRVSRITTIQYMIAQSTKDSNAQKITIEGPLLFLCPVPRRAGDLRRVVPPGCCCQALASLSDFVLLCVVARSQGRDTR